MLVMNCSRQPVRMQTVAFALLFAAASLLFADVVQADNFRVNYFLFESRREPEIKVPSRLTRPEVARLCGMAARASVCAGVRFRFDLWLRTCLRVCVAVPFRCGLRLWRTYGYVPPYSSAAAYGYDPAYGYAPTRRYAPAYGSGRAYGYVARRTDTRDRRRDWRWPSPGWPINVKK